MRFLTDKLAITINNKGEVVGKDFKKHAAPGEEITEASAHSHTMIGGLTVSAYVCYDLHYPDINQRMHGAQLVAVPLNDAAFGRLQRDFHLADIALRAVENRSAVLIAATNGPTAYIDEYGVVRQQLPYDEDGVLVIE